MKLKKFFIVSALSLSMIMVNGEQSEAASVSHQVKSGDTYWNVAIKHGVSVMDLMAKNSGTKSEIYPGQELSLPQSPISDSDKELIARLVHAEAEAEPYAGKVAVATVVLNRVASSEFPDTVKGVIYEKANGYFAFTPVQNGAINRPAGPEAKKAVNEAIAFRGQGQGSLFFYNPATSSSDWIYSRHTTIKIGKHVFAK